MLCSDRGARLSRQAKWERGPMIIQPPKKRDAFQFRTVSWSSVAGNLIKNNLFKLLSYLPNMREHSTSVPPTNTGRPPVHNTTYGVYQELIGECGRQTAVGRPARWMANRVTYSL